VLRRLAKAPIGFYVEPGTNGVQPGALDKNDPALLSYVEPDDLVHYGLIPELVGRMPVMTALDQLTPTELRRILTEPKSALVKQYRKLFAMDGVDLFFDDEALDAVVTRALDRGTGARGLRAVLEDTLLDVMFDAPGMHGVASCRITRRVVTGDATPVYEERKASA
ncbi:MAG: ATP-dependent Clp protease ATP-binding subunit ClpX, partial [Bacteroidota bacterium]